MPAWAYVNGKFVPFEEASLPVEDRATQFGDGVYEVARIYEGVPFAFSDHVQRMQKGASIIGIPWPWEEAELQTMVDELIARNNQQDGIVYWQVSRGTAPRSHVFPPQADPNLIAYTRDYPDHAAAWEQGVKVTIERDVRWLLCHVKSVNLLGNVLAKEAAASKGGAEALLEREGYGIVEGGSSNVFIVKDGVLATPPLSELILPGITRSYVLEIAAEQGMSAAERYISREELLQADEVFFTSTGVEVMPVAAADGHTIGSGALGPVTKQLLAAYKERVAAACSTAPR